MQTLGTIETLAVVVIGVGSLCYGLLEAATYGTGAVPLQVIAGIAGYVAVWLYIIVRGELS
jgi:hypothetical protein